MISIRLKEMLMELQTLTKQGRTLKKVAEESGVMLKTLIKLQKEPKDDKPHVEVTLETIDKLVQYFYRSLQPVKSGIVGVKTDTDLLRWILTNLVEVFPDDAEFWSILVQSKSSTRIEDGKTWAKSRSFQNKPLILRDAILGKYETLKSKGGAKTTT